jgi:hypothetical protein
MEESPFLLVIHQFSAVMEPVVPLLKASQPANGLLTKVESNPT